MSQLRKKSLQIKTLFAGVIFTLNICYNYSLIQLMNSFSLLKLIIPSIKPSNLLQIQTQKVGFINTKIYHNQAASFGSAKDESSPNNRYTEWNDLHIAIPLDQNEKTIDDEESVTKSNSSRANFEAQFQKNFITNRIKSLQYEANNPCEDSMVCQQLKSINAYTISIFDGHGGPQLAEYCKIKINSFIQSYLQDNLERMLQQAGSVIKEALSWSYQKIEDTFFETYQKQVKLGNKKIRNVGTCAITAVVHADKIYLANAGDSQAIFLLKQGLHMTKAQKINQRLSVNNKYERERLKQKWNGIDDNIITQESNNIYYLKGRLQPTRTIGDYYLKRKEYYYGSDVFKGPYLTCQPEISEHQLSKAHKFLVVASDGIWDTLSRQQVLDILIHQRQIDLSKTCYDVQQEQAPFLGNVVNNILEKVSNLCGKSLEQLKNIEKGARRNYHDDITLAVINLQNQI